MVEEDEGADHAALAVRQGAVHAQAANVMRNRGDDDIGPPLRTAGSGVMQPRHFSSYSFGADSFSTDSLPTLSAPWLEAGF
jgi:hypothetical protein